MLKSITKWLPSLYIDVPALRPGTVGAYALALVSVGVATVLRLALDPYVVGVQFITFAPAVIITTLIIGFGAGFFCVVLSTAAADFFVLEPRWSFNVDDPANVADLLLFGPVASYCAFLIGRMRLAIEREQETRALQASKDRLQLALNGAHLGWWQYDPLRRTGSRDTRANEIHDFDIAENEKVALEELLKRVHPDDAVRFRRQSRRRSIPPIRSRSRMSTEFGGKTAASAGWRTMDLLISRGPALSDGSSASLAPSRTLPNARSVRNGSASSCARLIIAPRICSVSWTRLPTRPPPEILKIS
jgi:PAS domain-containing protein